jgi:(2R)-3-sulfolactate dehydrogenase (NADP+)
LSLSEVARGKLLIAAAEGKPIPPGWALDASGNPTTDAQAGLSGSMLPFGGSSGSKGAMLALMVELLVTALIGAQFSFEATSFFAEEGNQPRIGQAFLLINPEALAGAASYNSRLELLIDEMLRDPGVRLPGARRRALEQQAGVDGIRVPPALRARLLELAEGTLSD